MHVPCAPISRWFGLEAIYSDHVSYAARVLIEFGG